MPEELLDFAGRYRAALDARGLVDFPTLLQLAADVARSGADGGGRYDHVLADDFEAATGGAANLLRSVAAGAGSTVVAGNPAAAVGSQQGADPRHLLEFAAAATRIDLPVRLRDEPVATLICTHHPALEPEAVARELRRAADAGVSWSRMAVLVRRPATRARAIGRALGRAGIPAAVGPAAVTEEPIVAALLDLLRWAGGDDGAGGRLAASALSGLAPAEVDRVRRHAREAGHPVGDEPSMGALRAIRDELAARAATDDVATLAHRAFRRTLADLVADAGGPEGPTDPESGRALDAAVAFLADLDAFVADHADARLADFLASLEAPGADLDPWRWGARAGGIEGVDAVEVSSLAAAAGREWDVVVVAGCVEGELPRWPRSAGLFDDPVPGLERLVDALAEERRLFGLAAGAATQRLIATAGPEPGQLRSRFVAGWSEVEAEAEAGSEVGAEAEVGPALLAESPGGAPVWPDGVLTLSASQLTTYADCPLKYAFSYALRIRDEGNVWASMGSLFHAIVAEFLRPDPEVTDRSRERLLRIANEQWTDEVALYRPQRDEVRRLLSEMLDRWYESEIEPSGGPDVVAVEHRFRIDVGPHVVSGSIDRVDRVADGIEIVDYKTGKSMLKPEEAADDLQLAVYHLAASRDPELAAFGPARRLRLRYVRTGQDREQPVAADHAGQTEARVLALADQIVSEAFVPSLEADCDHCHFHRLCPLQPAGREVGAP